ncbi:MAG: DUF6500 family protein [Flavobacteriales bacterium]
MQQKGENVVPSLHAFFLPIRKELLSSEWWIKKNELHHFEKALKIKNLVRVDCYLNPHYFALCFKTAN